MVLFLRMWHGTRGSTGHGQGHEGGGDEDLPNPPSLAEVMLEAERNKCETNHLLECIEQNTAC